MSELFSWLVFIPVLVMSLKFWLAVWKWLGRNRQTLASRVQRAKSAFNDLD